MNCRWGNTQKDGFTIVELLIVIVVIAILAAVTIVAFNGVQQRAAASVAQSNAANAIRKVEIFNAENGAYPTSVTDCPTPASSALCLKVAEGESLLYRTYTQADQPDIQLASMNDKQFFYQTKGEAVGPNEFLRFADIAPLIDRYGLVRYRLGFDIKSTNASTDNSTQVYMQNGSTTKYGGPYTNVTVSETYQHYEMTFTATLSNASDTQAWLAFYGTYGTGNRPVVNNVTLSLAP